MELSDPVSRLMTGSVLKAHPKETLLETARLMREARISGMPVVDEEDRLIGLISEVDLIRDLNASTGIVQPRGLLDLLLESRGKDGESPLEAGQRRLAKARVEEAMVRKVITIDPDTSISEAARLMNLNGVSRIPVVDEQRKVLGIVTHVDILRAITGVRYETRGKRIPSVKRAKGAGAGSSSAADPFIDI